MKTQSVGGMIEIPLEGKQTLDLWVHFKSVKVVKNKDRLRNCNRLERLEEKSQQHNPATKKGPQWQKMEKVTSGQYINSYCTNVNFSVSYHYAVVGCTKMLTLGKSVRGDNENYSDFISADFLYFFISSIFKINKSIFKNWKPMQTPKFWLKLNLQKLENLEREND